MNEAELRAWCTRLQQLRVLVEVLAEAHLKECAPPQLSLVQRRYWAASMLSRPGEDSILQQPANLLDSKQVRKYKQEMRQRGCYLEHCVVFRLPGGQKQLAQQIIDFPLTVARRIADAFCELFGEHPSGFAWLRMIEFEALGDGWAYLVREVI